MTPMDIALMAHALMKQHGLHDWKFAWDRGKSRAGCCKHRRKVISLSGYYVTHNLDKVADIRDTILHEIAHALAGPRKGHGPEWKAVCVRIGAKPIRCYDSEVIAMPKGNWQATCGRCQKLYHRHRKPKLVPGRYFYCTRCGPEHRLTFTRDG